MFKFVPETHGLIRSFVASPKRCLFKNSVPCKMDACFNMYSQSSGVYMWGRGYLNSVVIHERCIKEDGFGSVTVDLQWTGPAVVNKLEALIEAWVWDNLRS